jgi:hypothetical protein
MQFKVPEALHSVLTQYDSVLKQQAKLKKVTDPTKKTTKPKHPHGNVNFLVPADVLSPEELQTTIDHINTQPVEHRHYLFNRPDTYTGDHASVCLIYHYESMWLAAWLPPKKDQGKYVYGLSIAYKNNVTTTSKLWGTYLVTTKTQNNPLSIINLGTVQYPKVNRTEYLHCTVYVTKELIKRIANSSKYVLSSGHPIFSGWKLPNVNSWSKKTCHLYPTIEEFQKELCKTIPNIESEHPFSLITAKNFGTFIAERTEYSLTGNMREWCEKHELTFDTLLEYILDQYNNYLPEHIKPIALKHFNSPAIKAELAKHYALANHWFESSTAGSSMKNADSITNPIEDIFRICQMIIIVTSIWNDVPVDYFRSRLDDFILIRDPQNFFQVNRWQEYKIQRHLQWLADNMQVKTFFNMFDKMVQEHKQEQAELSYPIKYINVRTWIDTINMLIRLVDHSTANALPAPERPKRWRLMEWHDQLASDHWKIKTPNEVLPQDLFPQPININNNGIKLTFFQPMDIHQLAEWGQAVRNCVGSAGYADGVKKHKHFIVLGMIDNHPFFTIQLDMHNGYMNVKQIVGLSNARLSDQERSLYEESFKQALELQASMVS